MIAVRLCTLPHLAEETDVRSLPTELSWEDVEIERLHCVSAK